MVLNLTLSEILKLQILSTNQMVDRYPVLIWFIPSLLYEVCSKRYLDLEVQPGRLKNEFQAICNLMDRYAYGDPHFHC